MFSAANKFGWKSNRDPCAALERARALLDTALITSGEDTQAVAMQFERLARRVQTALDFAIQIVDCYSAGLDGVYCPHGAGVGRIRAELHQGPHRLARAFH